MEDCTIHPSMKAIRVGYLLAAVVAAGGVWAIGKYAADPPNWLFFLPLVAFLLPLKGHLMRRLITLRIHDNHLTLETGFFSRMRRTVDMAKIQDVTVQQTLGQRMMGVGDLMLESAGESGAMAIQNLDRPRDIADAIIGSSKRSNHERGNEK